MLPRQYRHLFFDLDHTLWDFDANARATLEQLHVDLRLPEKGIADFDAFYRSYALHNEKLWARYRKGYIRQEELRVKRMWLALLDFKIADEDLSRQLSQLFLQILPTKTLLFPDTHEVLTYLLNRNYELHLITNGFEDVQLAKLRGCGLNTCFRHVVTSEASGSLKPAPEIFHYALNLANATVHESLMIGDTMDVDIAGAKGVGMDQVHVNYNEAKQTFPPTYTVTALKQLMDFL